MKFLVTSGRKKGFTFKVTAAAVRIGRSKDNEIVLDDESISGHHAKIFAEGGQVLVEDCDSINGIEVNGKVVKKSLLQKSDVITIGLTQITAVGPDESAADEDQSASLADKPASDEDRSAAESPGDDAPKMPEADPEDAADVIEDEELPEKAEKKPAVPQGGFRKRAVLQKIVAAVLVVAVIALAWFVLKRKTRAPREIAAPPASKFAEGIFRLRYEKVKASAENIFRYEMKIENDLLAVTIDDLKQERKVRRDKALDPARIAELRDAILDQQIFTLPSKIEGKSQNVWDSLTVSVVARGQAHTVHALNRIPPDNFKKVCKEIEDFVDAETGTASVSLSPDELKKRAQDAFQRGRELYDKRTVNAENLFNSIKAYSEAIWLLDSLEPKPSTYKDALQGKATAAEELDQQLEDHKFRATRAKQLKEWKKEYDELYMILQKLPDKDDKRHKDARIRLLEVEKHLQSK
ncbi:MAG: FHA domain-containing protein [Verrucomicrobia bacterium]|nr:FHA domain-containing protein [Verrucomicrobiota bacterium]